MPDGTGVSTTTVLDMRESPSLADRVAVALANGFEELADRRQSIEAETANAEPREKKHIGPVASR